MQNLPESEQEKVSEVLQDSLKTKMRPAVNEDDIEKLLLAEGVISEIPERSPDDEEET